MARFAISGLLRLILLTPVLTMLSFRLGAELPVILDASFDPGSGANGAIQAFLAQPDGKTLLFGEFSHVQGVPRRFGARLNADGSLDPTFIVTNIAHQSGLGSAGLPAVLQPDGKVVVSYFYLDASRTLRTGIMRLNPDGTRDTSFNVTLAGPASDLLSAMALQPDGKILLGGFFETVNGASRKYLARLNTNGTLDATLNAGTNAYSLTALAVQADGKIVVARQSYASGGSSNSLMRFNSNGTMDSTFTRAAPWHASGPVFKLAIQPDGKILYAEESLEAVGGLAVRRLARLNADGSVDAGFDARLVAFRIRALTPLPDGKILIGGRVEFTDGTVRAVARLNADGSRDATFDVGIDAGATPYGNYGPEPAIDQLALHADGRLVLAGSFKEVSGVQRPGLARVFTDPTGLSSLDFAVATYLTGEDSTNVTLSVLRRGPAGSSVMVDFATSNLTAQADLDYTTNSGALNFAPGETNKTITIPLLDDAVVEGQKSFLVTLKNAGGIALGAGKTATVTISDNERPVRVDLSLDPGIGVSTTNQSDVGYIFDLATLTNGQMLAFGRFTHFQGLLRRNLARLNADGSVDPSFDSFNSQGGLNGVIYEFAVQPDGKIVIGGEFTRVGIVTRNRIARLNADGSVDLAFNPTGGANDVVDAMALQPGGKILIGGYFTTVAGVSRKNVARLNADGTLDGTFNPGVSLGGITTSITTIAVQSDEKILLGGWFSQFGGVLHDRIVRLNSNGTVDASFTAGLQNHLHGAYNLSKIEVLPNGKILIAGEAFNQVNGVPRIGLARLNADGTLDTGFDAQLSAFSFFKSLVGLPDGRVYLAGDITFADGTRNWAARFHEDGSRDGSFDVPLPAGQELNELAAQPDGRVLVSGVFTSVDGVPRAGLARLFADAPALTQVDLVQSEIAVDEAGGTVVASLQRLGESSSPLTVNVATTNGTAQAGADYTAVSTPVTFAPLETLKTVSIPILDDPLAEGQETFRLLLAQVPAGVFTGRTETPIRIRDEEASGSVDRTYSPTFGLSQPAGGARPVNVTSLTMQSDGKCLVSFQDNYAGGNPPPFALVRLQPDGSRDTTFPFIPGVSKVSLTDDGKIFAVQNMSETKLLVLNSDGSQASAVNATPDMDGFISGACPLPEGKFLVYGWFSSVNGAAANYLARLHANGAVDSSFNILTGPDSGVNAAVVQPDGKILIGGAFEMVRGVTRRGIARLNADGTVDDTFTPGTGFLDLQAGFGAVYQLALQPDGRVLAVGYFNRFNGAVRNRVARLNKNGTLDTTFNAGAGPLYDYGNGTTEPTLLDNVTLQPDGKIVLNGGFNLFHGQRLPGLVRLKPNGALDDSFAPGSFSLDGNVSAVAVAPDGAMLVGGGFASFAGFPCSGLVRLKNDFDVLVHSLSRLDVNRVQVTGLAQAGKSYTLQSSEDLANWTDRDTRTATGATWLLEDQTSANLPNRFYRVLKK
jgi:uncharacterized delta-60 repeat protein